MSQIIILGECHGRKIQGIPGARRQAGRISPCHKARISRARWTRSTGWAVPGLKNWGAVSSEVTHFVAERIHEDVKTQHQILNCKKSGRAADDPNEFRPDRHRSVHRRDRKTGADRSGICGPAGAEKAKLTQAPRHPPHRGLIGPLPALARRLYGGHVPWSRLRSANYRPGALISGRPGSSPSGAPGLWTLWHLSPKTSPRLPRSAVHVRRHHRL